jgi:hypothetical protein
MRQGEEANRIRLKDKGQERQEAKTRIVRMTVLEANRKGTVTRTVQLRDKQGLLLANRECLTR